MTSKADELNINHRNKERAKQMLDLVKSDFNHIKPGKATISEGRAFMEAMKEEIEPDYYAYLECVPNLSQHLDALAMGEQHAADLFQAECYEYFQDLLNDTLETLECESDGETYEMTERYLHSRNEASAINSDNL